METQAETLLGPELVTPWPEVTIVMPVLNEERHLPQVLRSVMEQDYPLSRLEVLVVDGGSVDRTREIVRELAARFPAVRIKLLDNPKGIISAAMNIGIRNAQGEVILRVDGHCILAADYVRRCLEYLFRSGADNVGGPAQPVGETYVGEVVALATSSPFGHGGSTYRYSQQEGDVDTVFLGAFRRDLFERIGGYDEGLICVEDFELNQRIRAAGGRVLLTPAIKVWYITRSSLLGVVKQYFRYGYWRLPVVRKHPQALRIRHLGTAGFLLTLLLSGLLGLFNRLGLFLFLTVLSIYLVTSLLSSLLQAHRAGWRYLPLLPLAFACIHFSWGAGLLFWGLTTMIPCFRTMSESRFTDCQ